MKEEQNMRGGISIHHRMCIDTFTYKHVLSIHVATTISLSLYIYMYIHTQYIYIYIYIVYTRLFLGCRAPECCATCPADESACSRFRNPSPDSVSYTCIHVCVYMCVYIYIYTCTYIILYFFLATVFMYCLNNPYAEIHSASFCPRWVLSHSGSRARSPPDLLQRCFTRQDF